MSKKIVHIGHACTFMSPFIELVKSDFDFESHLFYLTLGATKYKTFPSPNIKLAKRTFFGRAKYYLGISIKMHQAEKIMLHGLFDYKTITLLFFMPWLLKKCYWVIWGGDLYCYQLNEKSWGCRVKEFLRKKVIKKIGHLVTYIKGDYKLAQQWYGAQGQYHECFMYPSNLYQEYTIPDKVHEGINIQVGNSADPSNNHLDIFKRLEKYHKHNVTIYVPLTYGGDAYADEVIKEGRKIFGDKFIPLTEHVPFHQYLAFLGSVDIAIFNHKRQQAMGNTITLLGLGKKVYMRSDVTQWDFFKDHDIVVYDIENINIYDLDEKVLAENRGKIKNYLSYENYKNQLECIFNQ
ncbi:TDP-N-acetylfucosamine:lipid II N-acetylfucosaminyltransferase [Aeromonas sp. 2HA2]|uniref:TDP-N-acetylfucosamine:lipid II N-acetylfucosaminyltransferase n=2 Tax=Aeromonas TaxID=642 RepID=UPI0023DDF495|nr:TDP-N-acetylfucosamine:lipid II N-acetylfucosaminyltransferase [Aeromonas sp. 2HA2]MDF2407997.1 TDP-N-acetylfucosamine:lipid II N-acetylfucosaminyltransferase [Aeromonas sp. 2HA2]